MLCPSYRCAQDKKLFRKQLCSWSTKALHLVGLEEVLVSAHGKKSREQLPLSSLDSPLSDVVNAFESDDKICGFCGKSKQVCYIFILIFHITDCHFIESFS